jgi:hypothetical protein
MTNKLIPQQDQEFIIARKRRSWMIALGLMSFVLIIYFVSMVRMGESVKAKQAASETSTPTQAMNKSGQ